MSASREKKLRQEALAQGLSEKEIKRMEEERKEARKWKAYGAIFIAVAVVFVALIIWNSNLLQKNLTAITVGNEKLTAADVQFYYDTAYNQLTNSWGDFLPYVLDTTKSLRSQQYFEEDRTWHDYLLEQTYKIMQETLALSGQAAADGYVLTEDGQAEIDGFFASVDEVCATYGISRATYFASFGDTMTEAIFRRHMTASILASEYSASILGGLNYSVEDMNAYYAEHPEEIDLVDYRYYLLSASEFIPEVQEGDDEEALKALAMPTAKLAADEMAERLRKGDDFTDVVVDHLGEAGAEYDPAASTVEGQGRAYITSNVSGAVADWLFEDGRRAGDVTVIEGESGYYVLSFGSRYRQEYDTVDVRHILIKPVVDEGAEAATEEQMAEAKAKAERIYEEWKAGQATEDSFAELANAESEDPGSNTTGGLYEKVYKNQMVQTFNDWIFDPARKGGDSGIVETEHGYHIMYFSGNNVPYWQIQAESVLRTAAYTEWSDALLASYPVGTPGLGMRFVG